MPDFQVWVRTGAEEPVCVEVPSEGTVGDVIAGLPGEVQSGVEILFAGEVLPPETALADAGIGNEAVLECAQRSVPQWVCPSTIEQRPGSGNSQLELVKLETGQDSCNCPEMLTPGYEYHIEVYASSGCGDTSSSAAIVLGVAAEAWAVLCFPVEYCVHHLRPDCGLAPRERQQWGPYPVHDQGPGGRTCDSEHRIHQSRWTAAD
eukprot:TRINITY_DN1312_c0_g2_i3.p1 TRINITY_DN1312_c0_g2~~TRINITY_DN1312_c0_g2_i3.p1  ORF type:complete len:205 (+),score=9.71 TRINITY_DN1312_c0_g2_i3:92-706(+)